MLDLVGTISLIVFAVVLVAALAPSREWRGASRMRLGVGIGAWFLAALGLGIAGAFASPALPVGVAVGLAVFVPVIAGWSIVTRTHGFGIPLPTLVAVHAGRVLGAAFLVLFSMGRLPSTFAHSAGWGDIVTGVSAIPVAWAVQRQVPGWKWLAGIWNAFGMADLLAAVTLGVGSAPGSLVRFIYEPPGAGAIATMPWVLIPAFFVPLFLLTHIAIFGQLVASARTAERKADVGAVHHLPAR